MPVIAMTREMGTRGKDVAAGLAEKLGLEVVHHELVERQVAERLDLGESVVHRFLEGQASLWDNWKIDPRRLSRYTSEEVLLLAQKGNVIIRGWGAAQLLAGVAHVIRVRVCAPMSVRVATMMERLASTKPHHIEREIVRNDEAHTRTIERNFGSNWRDPVNYDIVLNTADLPIETCISAIATLIDCPHRQETDASRRALVDRLVEARVRDILDSVVREGPIGNGLDIRVKNGEVVLDGVADDNSRMRDALDRIAQISGVTAIDNRVHRIPQRFGV